MRWASRVRRTIPCRAEALECRRLLSASLLQDLNPDTLSSNPTQTIDINGTAFFAADDGVSSIELWKSDGTAGGTVMVKDIETGFLSPHSAPMLLTRAGDILYFFARTADHGYELWKSDGTADGTVMVRDINPGPAFGANFGPNYPLFPSQIVAIGDTVYFGAEDGKNGVELWKSDGTAEGTIPLTSLSANQGIRELVAFNDKLYFAAGIPNGTEWRLYVSDGTPEGTTRLSDGAVYPTHLTTFNGHLYFVAWAQGANYELWRTDGTPEGTALFKDVRPGVLSSNITDLTPVGDTLFFVADVGAGYDLWKTDGTAAGTVLVKDLLPNTSSSLLPITSLTEHQGALYFSYYDNDVKQTELWTSDGTDAGTVRIKRIDPGPPVSGFSCVCPLGQMTSFDDRLYFTAYTHATHTELWRTDGTEAGTVMVQDIAPGTRNSDPRDLRVVGGRLFLSASDGGVGNQAAPAVGRELWTLDPSGDGVSLVKDVNAVTGNAISPNPSSGGPGHALLGDKLVLAAYSAPVGRELFVTDGNELTLLSDLVPGPAASNPTGFQRLGDHLIFWTSDGTLWKTDGTPEGTVFVANQPIAPQRANAASAAVFRGHVYFASSNPVVFGELWRTDGTPEGTTLVKDLFVGQASSSPSDFVVMNDTLYFMTRDTRSTTASALWKSDGTAAGTTLVKAGLETYPAAGLVASGGKLFFHASGVNFSPELWVSDGTEDGTHIVKDINPIGAGLVNGFIFPALGKVFFAGNDAVHGAELWVSDGTPDGTYMVKDINPSTSFLNVDQFAEMDGLLYFRAGNDLWRTDGTEANTGRVRAGVSPTNPVAINGRLFFGGTGPGTGRELWSTDGSEAGTGLVADLRAGVGASNPTHILALNDHVLLAANDGLHGHELWVLRSPPAIKDGQLLVRGGDGIGGVSVSRSPHSFLVEAIPSDAAPDARPAAFSFAVGSVDAIYIAAGDGEKTIRLVNLEDQPLAFAFSAAGAKTLILSGVNHNFDPNGELGNVHLVVTNTSTVNMPVGQRLTALSVDGSRVRITGQGGAVLLGQLDLIGWGNIDLAGNDLVLDTSPATRDALRATLASHIREERLFTSLSQSSPTFGLAILDGDRSTLLVRPTWNGDADGSGVIDLDDYFAIDSNFLAPPQNPTYAHGDFNYDGEINLDDYFLIDSAFLAQDQGAPAVAASAATIEPVAATFVKATHRRRRPSRASVARR